MSKSNASDKLCFVNFIFKNGCTDSVAVAETSENLWKEFLSKFCRDGKALKNNILTFNGIDGNACVDMSTVAKIEISDKDKGPLVLVNSQVNDDETDISLPSKFMDACVAKDKDEALRLAKLMAKQHSFTLEAELDLLDFDSSSLSSEYRLPIATMIKELRKYEA